MFIKKKNILIHTYINKLYKYKYVYIYIIYYSNLQNLYVYFVN